jgi:hypothetical protein
MESLIVFTYYTNLSLLLLHEMDAVRRREWNMMFAVNKLADESAYIVFSVLHLPLYVMMFYLVCGFNGAWGTTMMWALSVFFVLHGVVHKAFRAHASNEFRGVYSNLIIYSMSAIGLLQMVLLICR